MITSNPVLQKAFFTDTEIFRQPELWAKISDDFKSIKSNLKKFFERVFSNENIQVILTGAGTSAFIGDVLLGSFSKNLYDATTAIATTDLITHPEIYFNKNKEYLLISFARSGNSPESAQAIFLSEEFSKKVYHLIITCNNDSELTKAISNKDSFIILMPPEADDKGLAMTSSFTTMLLAGLLISRINLSEELARHINILLGYGQKLLNNHSNDLKEIAELDFKRAVFLGSGMLKGIARESHLKLQELTDGKVICKYDSFMGFRHGPKAVIDESTLVVYLFSNNPYVNLYEMDLVNAVANGRKNLFTLGLMEKEIEAKGTNLNIVLSSNGERIPEEFLPVVSVLPAQLLGFYKSLNLGLNPDSPSSSGMIHRVVQGVKIYPITANK